MKLTTKLAAVGLLLAGTSVAQATTYNVNAIFGDGGVQGLTQFTGSFDWNGTSVSNFTGYLSESMWEWNSAAGKFSRTMMNGSIQYENVYVAQNGTAGYNYDKTIAYNQGDAPLLHLTNMVDNSLISGASVGAGQHAASVFLKGTGGVADTNAYNGGGYDATSSDLYYGKSAGEVRNWNAFFSLVFDTTNPTNTSLVLNSMEYGDCNQLGMMGSTCMTGLTNGGIGGSMGGMPGSLSISAAPVAAVPVPGAVWLFGGALMSVLGINRRKNAVAA